MNLDYNKVYEQIAKNILNDNKLFIYYKNSSLYEYVERYIEAIPDYLFPELEGKELENKNEEFLEYLAERESKIIEKNIFNQDVKDVIQNYKSNYDPEKTTHKLKFYIGGEYHEPLILVHNGIEPVELDTSYIDVKLFLIWARAQENIEIETNARW